MEIAKHFVYMLQCKDQSLYTGYTVDVEKRLAEHNAGKGAKYTRGRTPCKVVYIEEFETKGEALKREYEVKQLSRLEKVKLIRQQLLDVMFYEDTE